MTTLKNPARVYMSLKKIHNHNEINETDDSDPFRYDTNEYKTPHACAEDIFSTQVNKRFVFVSCL